MQLGNLLRVLSWTCGLILAAGSVHAQATRTWVSGVGDDANPCSRTAPCKTFAGAISKTATDGTINTLDPAGYGAVTISKGITIQSDGAGTAGVLASGTTGIIVNAPVGSRVYLRNLQIEGGVTGLAGIRVISGDVHVDNCTIQNFRGNPGVGINVVATLPSRVFVSNSSIMGNLVGIASDSTTSAPIPIQDTTIDRNQDYGIRGSNVNAIFSLNRSSVLGSPVNISAPAPAKVQTFGNNAITGIEAGTVLTPIALQ